MSSHTIRYYLSLITLLILPLCFSGCASFGPTKPNLPYSGESYPAILNELAHKNPFLVQELGKLPEIQDGISEKDVEVLKEIIKLYNVNPQVFDEAFGQMNQIGLPEYKKYCSPLQAVFWLVEDGKNQKAEELIQEYNLDRLLYETWKSDLDDVLFKTVISDNDALEIAKNGIIDKRLGSFKQSTKSSYDTNLRNYSEAKDAEIKSNILNFIREKIILDYQIDKSRFTKKARRIVKESIAKRPGIKTDLRWNKFDVVVDRLNAPELIDYYEKTNFIYDLDYWRQNATARSMFKKKKGNCDAYSDFTIYCLKRAGYRAWRIGVVKMPGGYWFHSTTVYRDEDGLYVLDNAWNFAEIKGPFKSIAEIRRFYPAEKDRDP